MVPTVISFLRRRRAADDPEASVATNGKRPAYLDDFPEHVAAGWTGVRNPQAPEPPGKVKAKAIVYLMLAAVPISLLALLVAIAGLGSGGRQESQGRQLVFTGAAQVSVSEYLAGRPFSLPVASGVVSDARPISERQRDSQDDEDPTPVSFDVETISVVDGESFTLTLGQNQQPTYFETHRFAVTTSDGDYFWVAVTVMDRNGPVLAALPQIGPPVVGHFDSAVRDGISWPEIIGSRGLGSQAPPRIKRWALAYGADDRDTLHELTGDTRTGVEYRGVGGYDLLKDPQVISVGGPEDDPVVVARVQVTYASKTDPDLVVVMEFDLLIENLDGSLPTIAAWGPVGSGPRLQPFENAMPPDPNDTGSGDIDDADADDDELDDDEEVETTTTTAKGKAATDAKSDKTSKEDD